MNRGEARRIDRALRRAEAWLRRTVLDVLPTTDELRTVELEHDEEGAAAAAGTRPAARMRDARGRRYLFKQAEPFHVAGEELAAAVRAHSERLHVPAVRRLLPVEPGAAPVEGLLQPMLAHEGERLGHDATSWSPLQRETILREHPWEWVLGNLDAHEDQYLLLGPERLPVDIDWDHSLMDLPDELTRFTARAPTIVPVHNALYDDYVHGRLTLSFRGLRREIAHIEAIPPARLGEVVRQYGRSTGLEPAAIDDLVARVLRRQQALDETFSHMIDELRRERAQNRPPLPTLARDVWQRIALDVIQPWVMRPLFRLYRGFLTRRTRRGAG